MEYIKNRFYQKASKCVNEYQRLKNEHGDKVIANVTIEQVMTGMKGVPSSNNRNPVSWIHHTGTSRKIAAIVSRWRAPSRRSFLPDVDW